MAQKDSQQPLADELGTTETVSILQGGVLRRLLLTILRARSSHTGTQAISTVSGLQAALDAKLDAEDYSDRFKGSYVSLAALEAAHPTAVAGDFAVVDAGAGAAPRQYLWDADTDEWAAGSDVAPANTDALAEGASNFWFTAARVRDTLMTGVSFLTATAVEATDSLLTAVGKLQAQISRLYPTPIAWSAFAALDPGDYSDGHRFKITDKGGLVVEHDGTRFVQMSPVLPAMVWANRPAAAEKWRGWRLRITDFGGVDVGFNGATWQALGQFTFHSTGGHTHTGNVSQHLLVEPSVPFDLLGVGGRIDYLLRRAATTSNSWLRLRVSTTAGSLAGTAATQLEAAAWQIFEKAILLNTSSQLIAVGTSGAVTKTGTSASGVGISGSFAGQTLYLACTCQLSDAGDTFTLEQAFFLGVPAPFVEV